MPNEANYTKEINCPEHPEGDHKAVLYMFGHQYAGIWECPVTGSSDSCEHESTHIAIGTEDHLGFNGHYQTDHEYYECDACECTVDGNPAEDRADAIADMQIMEALGK